MLHPYRHAVIPSSKFYRLVAYGATLGISLCYIKLHGPVRRMICCAVDGLHYQAVGTWFQAVHFHFHTNRDHGISFLDKIIRASDFGNEYLLVGRSLENAAAHAHIHRLLPRRYGANTIPVT